MIYLLELPERKFSTEFVDIERNTTFQLDVEEGDVIIFPSYMEHSSPMNRKSKNRVTVTLPLVLEENEQGRETNIKEPTS